MPTFIQPVKSEYAYETTFTGPAPRPEPPRVVPTQHMKPALLKYLHWTETDLVAAQERYGFPKSKISAGRLFDPFHPDAHTPQVWLQNEVDKWVSERRAQIAELSDLLNRR